MNTEEVINKINIIYRLCEQDYNKPSGHRPVWFSKKACLFSFLSAANYSKDHIDKIIFLHDGPEGELFEIIKHYHYVKIDYQNNGNSMYTSFDIANQLGENIYFVEDDYLHNEDSIIKTLFALNKYKLVSGYDHPDRYIRTDDIEYQKHVDFDFIGRHHWRSSEAICGTFAIKKDIWIQIESLARHYFPFYDREFFRHLHNIDIPLYTAIPGLITQVDPFLSPGVDWINVNKKFI